MERFKEHLLGRGGVLLGGALVASAWALAPRPKPPEARSVATMLGDAVHGIVDEGDFVWGPSRGWLLDLTAGREVVFLFRRAPEEPRDPCRALVSVAPDGRPLSVRKTSPLAPTLEGDERDLVLGHGRAAFSTWFGDKPQSVVVEELSGDQRVMRIALPPDARNVAFELSAADVVLSSDQPAWSSVVSFADAVATAGAPARVIQGATRLANGEPDVARLNVMSSPRDEPLPIGEFVSELSFAQDRTPAVSSRTDGAARVVVVDGRQFEFYLQLGPLSPPSQTGYLPKSASIARRGRPDVAFALAIPRSEEQGHAGAFDARGFSASMHSGAATLIPEDGYSIALVPWAGGPWDRMNGELAIQWPSGSNQSGGHAVCVMRGGHLAFATSETEPDVMASLPAACVATVAGRGPLTWLSPTDGILPDRERDASLVVGTRRAFSPSIAPPKGATWAAAKVQPTPSFLPAVFEARAEALGTEVSVVYVEPSRVRWSMVAGEKERPHREGRELDKGLAPGDAARARLSVSLGYAKRKGPRGLRIRGNTGLAISSGAAVLAIRGGALHVFSSGTEPETVDDASELPLVAAEGGLRPEARELGPRQRRADLCVSPSGAVLVAESVFDSHEANATVLLALGCSEVVALDRGTEQPSETLWGDAAAGPFVTTHLVALDVPLVGAVRTRE